jgi:hypothetical protein
MRSRQSSATSGETWSAGARDWMRLVSVRRAAFEGERMMSNRESIGPGYGAVAKSLHWLIVLLLVVQFAVAWTMPEIHRGVQPEGLIGIHVSFGMVILAFALGASCGSAVCDCVGPVAHRTSLPWQRSRRISAGSPSSRHTRHQLPPCLSRKPRGGAEFYSRRRSPSPSRRSQPAKRQDRARGCLQMPPPRTSLLSSTTSATKSARMRSTSRTTLGPVQGEEQTC